MAKTAKPAIEKLKTLILNELTPEDQVELGDWFGNILAVREADAAAARRREATKQGETKIIGGQAERTAGSTPVVTL